MYTIARLSLLCLLLLLWPAGLAAAPSQIHLSWQGPTGTSMTVTWRSPSATGSVEYGASSSYGKSLGALSTPYAGSYLHIAELTGLTPASSYHYRCGSPGDWSSDLTFATAPAAGTPFTFAAYGDAQGQPAVRDQVMAAVKATAPAFSLHSGDLVPDGNVQAQWDDFFTGMQPLFSISPVMTALGNHENYSKLYFDQFAFPGHPPGGAFDDEAYYSFDYANVHFVVLNTEPPGGVGGPQYLWLKQDLAAAAARPDLHWLIVAGHRPPYSSSNHGSNLEVRQTFVHLFESFGVDLSFWGHDHNYERTKPLFQDQPAEGGLTYVVAGASGAYLYASGSSGFTAYSQSLQHFVEVRVEPGQLKLQARDVAGKVFDTHTISKSAPRSTWIMDGKLDAGAKKVASGPGPGPTSLWAGFDGRYLYVASEAVGAGEDRFILVSPTAPTPGAAAPWGKAGKVWSFSNMLAMESSNSWSNWQTPAGQNDPAWTRASNPAGEVMEGSIDLQGKLGTLPPSVFLAVAAYGTAGGGGLLGQVPAGNADADLGQGEWFELVLAPPLPDRSLGDAPSGDGPARDGGLAEPSAGTDGPGRDRPGAGGEPAQQEGCSCAAAGRPGSGSLLILLLALGLSLRSRRRSSWEG